MQHIKGEERNQLQVFCLKQAKKDLFYGDISFSKKQTKI